MLSHQGICLFDFIRSLLQSHLCRVDPAVALVDVSLHVPGVVVVESPPPLLLIVGGLVLGFQSFAMGLWACTKILFGVGKQVVWAGAD